MLHNIIINYYTYTTPVQQYQLQSLNTTALVCVIVKIK